MRTLIVLSVMIFLVPGCYTQLATIESALPSNEPETVIDSVTGDTIKVIRQVDTIVSQEKETCVWVRDMFGRPYLQCYDSYYSRSWLFYNNTPWWYRYYDDFRYGGYGIRNGGGSYHHSPGGSPQTGSSGSSISSSSGSSSSSGAPITGSSSRTTAQKASSPSVQSQPSGGSAQKAAAGPSQTQQPSSPVQTNNDQGTTKKRNIRSSRSR